MGNQQKQHHRWIESEQYQQESKQNLDELWIVCGKIEGKESVIICVKLFYVYPSILEVMVWIKKSRDVMYAVDYFDDALFLNGNLIVHNIYID